MTQKKNAGQSSRRDFIKSSSMLVAGGAVGSSLSLARSAHAAGSDSMRVGLIGCGGRGRGAAVQALNASEGSRLTAMGDVFTDRLQEAYRTVKGRHKERVEVPEDRKFLGMDAYKRVLDSDCDFVILATPPGFRPLHFEAAVEAGKHVFMEKPVASDAFGVRRVLAAGDKAKEKGLAVAVGLQRRHERVYQEVIAELQNGAIGDINCIRVYWNGGGVWCRTREEFKPKTELEYQMRNWYYFNWLCGDHIVEQHIHNLDVGNWLMNDFPVEANGMGGREYRGSKNDLDKFRKDRGQAFDHFSIEYTFGNGAKMFSQCRHIPNCWNQVREYCHGSKGWADIHDGKIYGPDGKEIWRVKDARQKRNGHQVEHNDLFATLRGGDIPTPEYEYGAKSTMTAILGRMVAYSGQQIRWDDAINSKIQLADFDALSNFNDPAPVQPDENGDYPVAIPGVSQVI